MVLTLATGCRAEVLVDIDVDEAGSGMVTAALALDPEAAAQLVDLRTGLQLADLQQAGWRVGEPEERDDGWTEVQVAKEFGNPQQLSVVLDELDGPDGVFRDIELQRSKTFARIDYQLSGALDPSGGFQRFADPELEAALGTTVVELAAQEGFSPDQVRVRLQTDLPGELRDASLIGTSEAVDGTVAWSVTLGETSPVPISAATTSRLVAPLVLRGVAVVAAVLAGLVLLGHALRLIRPETRRRPATAVRPRVAARAGHPSTAPPVPLPPAGEAGEGTAPTPPKVVALDAMGVLYREGDDVRRLLIPFARQRGSLLPDAELVDRARALSLGRITPAQFWAGIGVEGNPNELDQEYLSLHQLNPGVVRFLRALRERQIRAACVTNDAAAWAAALRRRHSLDSLIDLWVISGAVGVRKPDPPIFEALRRLAQVPVGDIMIIDDDRANLDAARNLGFRTAWFAPDGDQDQAGGHAVLRSLDVSGSPDQTANGTQPIVPAQ